MYQLLRATDTFYLDCACPNLLRDMLRWGCITATTLNSGYCYSISQLLLELCSDSPRCSTCILIGGGYIKIHMGGGSMQSCPIPRPFSSHSCDPCGIPQPLPLPKFNACSALGRDRCSVIAASTHPGLCALPQCQCHLAFKLVDWATSRFRTEISGGAPLNGGPSVSVGGSDLHRDSAQWFCSPSWWWLQVLTTVWYWDCQCLYVDS